MPRTITNIIKYRWKHINFKRKKWEILCVCVCERERDALTYYNWNIPFYSIIWLRQCCGRKMFLRKIDNKFCLFPMRLTSTIMKFILRTAVIQVRLHLTFTYNVYDAHCFRGKEHAMKLVYRADSNIYEWKKFACKKLPWGFTWYLNRLHAKAVYWNYLQCCINPQFFF